MCGRYYSLFNKQQVAEHFHVRRISDNVGIIAPNYNITLTPFSQSSDAAMKQEIASWC
jgi:hypothetical protein